MLVGRPAAHRPEPSDPRATGVAGLPIVGIEVWSRRLYGLSTAARGSRFTRTNSRSTIPTAGKRSSVRRRGPGRLAWPAIGDAGKRRPADVGERDARPVTPAPPRLPGGSVGGTGTIGVGRAPGAGGPALGRPVPLPPVSAFGAGSALGERVRIVLTGGADRAGRGRGPVQLSRWRWRRHRNRLSERPSLRVAAGDLGSTLSRVTGEVPQDSRRVLRYRKRKRTCVSQRDSSKFETATCRIHGLA